MYNTYTYQGKKNILIAEIIFLEVYLVKLVFKSIFEVR